MQVETRFLCNPKAYSLVYNSDQYRWPAIFIFLTSLAEGVGIEHISSNVQKPII